jgi:hypothetical protein
MIDKRVRKPVLLLAMAVTVALAVPTAASAGIAVNPIAVIGSTKGSGPAGCVAASKSVRFTLDPLTSPLFFTSAKVTLDGRSIYSTTYPIPSGRRAHAAFIVPVVRTFDVNVNLRPLKAGRHTLKLTGSVRFTPVRRSKASVASIWTPPSSANGYVGTAVETATITKCAVPKKKKPVFTG